MGHHGPPLATLGEQLFRSSISVRTLLEAHDGCATTLAEGHRTRLRSQAWLADVRCAQGRIESARALVDAHVLGTARAALGPTVDTTLLLEAVHARLECAA